MKNRARSQVFIKTYDYVKNRKKGDVKQMRNKQDNNEIISIHTAVVIEDEVLGDVSGGVRRLERILGITCSECGSDVYRFGFGYQCTKCNHVGEISDS